MSNGLVIDESRYKELTNVFGHTWVELENSLGVDVDANELCSHLLTVAGIRDISTLTITYNSCLKNAEIVRAFPNLQSLFIGGKNMISLDGLEMFTGEMISIQLGHKKRSIEKICVAPIKRLFLRYLKADDFCSIGKSRSINQLSLEKCLSPNMLAWRDVPLTYLGIQGSFTELCDLSSVKTLERVDVGSSRNFEKFAGDNSTIKALYVDSCKQFDLHSLSSFQHLELLNLVNCAPNISLSDLPDLPSLRFLGLFACKLNYDTFSLKNKFPKLEVFWPEKITAEQAALLSAASDDVIVKCNQKKYLNGVCID